MITNKFLEKVADVSYLQSLVLCDVPSTLYEPIKKYVDCVLSHHNWKHVLFFNYPLLEKYKNMTNSRTSINSFIRQYKTDIPVLNALQFGCNENTSYLNKYPRLRTSSIEADNLDILMSLVGHGTPYFFIDDHQSITLGDHEVKHYSIETLENRKLDKILRLYMNSTRLSPLKQLWGNHHFWIGYRTDKGRDVINKSYIVILNNNLFSYKIHPSWPDVGVFNSVPDGLYVDYLEGIFSLSIRNGILENDIVFPPKTLVVFTPLEI